MVSKRGVRLKVRVQPASSRDRVVGAHGDAVKVQVTATPVGGAANAALVEVLAKWLSVPRRAVAIIHGATGKDKLVEVVTDAPDELAERIESALRTSVDKAKTRR